MMWINNPVGNPWRLDLYVCQCHGTILYISMQDHYKNDYLC
jgi:hypothetical protein